MAGHSGQFTPGGLPVNCDTHYVSRHRTQATETTPPVHLILLISPRITYHSPCLHSHHLSRPFHYRLMTHLFHKSFPFVSFGLPSQISYLLYEVSLSQMNNLLSEHVAYHEWWTFPERLTIIQVELDCLTNIRFCLLFVSRFIPTSKDTTVIEVTNFWLLTPLRWHCFIAYSQYRLNRFWS